MATFMMELQYACQELLEIHAHTTQSVLLLSEEVFADSLCVHADMVPRRRMIHALLNVSDQSMSLVYYYQHECLLE